MAGKLKILTSIGFILIILTGALLSGIVVGNRYPDKLGLTHGTQMVKVKVNQAKAQGNGLTADAVSYQEVDFSTFWQAWDVIRTRHVDRPGETADLVDGAINGMLQFGFQDQFSSFLPPDLNAVASEDLSGSFSGVGIELEMVQGRLTVVTPLSGTPGEAAGILPGDIVTTINSESIDGLTLLEAVHKIRGPKETEVVLGIRRVLDAGEIKDFEQAITRGTVDVQSVTWEDQGEGIFLIRIRNFAADTMGEWDSAVKAISAKNPRGLIIDLRNNAGGYVNAAVHIISEFVESGTAVTEDFGDSDIKHLKVTGYGQFFDVPVIVLTNRGTASASEMLAGALQDTGRGRIIGVRSFGKGVLQEIYDIKIAGETQRASVRIVTAKWYTPSGRNVEYKGLQPDIEVKTTMEQYERGEDPVFDRALEELKQ